MGGIQIRSNNWILIPNAVGKLSVQHRLGTKNDLSGLCSIYTYFTAQGQHVKLEQDSAHISSVYNRGPWVEGGGGDRVHGTKHGV